MGFSGSYIAPLRRDDDGTGYVEMWRSVAQANKPDNAKFIAKANPVAVLALITEVDQLKAEVARSTEREIMQLAEIEALRKEISSLRSPAIRADKTTIGYTGCIVCGEYADHSGLQCPNFADRSLSMENQGIVPVEPIRVEHPLDALDRKLKP